MDNITSKLVLAFVTLLIGAVLISVVATQGLTKTTLTGVTNESLDVTTARQANETIYDINTSVNLTLTNANTGWKIDPSVCEITIDTFMFNVSKEATVTTDYIVSKDGIVTLVNSTGWNTNTLNASFVTYDYCPDEYMTLSWGRTGINLVPGFFAIAILLISLGLFYSVAKDTGLI